MKKKLTSATFSLAVGAAFALLNLAMFFSHASAETPEPADLPKATIDGTGPGWRELFDKDFQVVNGDDDTWTFKDGIIHCTGKPVGVMATKAKFKNFELVAQWRHLTSGGNSGIFVWATEEALKDLPKDKLPPGGIEVQILDHGYVQKYLERSKKPADTPMFFSTNGDIFPVGKSKMTPIPPTSPNGQRSFPRKKLAKGSPEWNHYYVRAINGEVRLWVNGEEVSGGLDCQPAEGFLCLESEGAPVEFKNVRIRELK